MKLIAVATGAALAVAAIMSGPAIAQDEFAGAIKARKGLMALYNANAGPLFGMAKGDMDYDAEAAAAYASNLVALSGLDQRNLWPQGSDNVALAGQTRAKPEIWSTYPDIVEKAQALNAAAVNLAAVAGNGQAELGAAVGGLGQACGACHEMSRGPAS